MVYSGFACTSTTRGQPSARVRKAADGRPFHDEQRAIGLANLSEPSRQKNELADSRSSVEWYDDWSRRIAAGANSRRTGACMINGSIYDGYSNAGLQQLNDGRLVNHFGIATGLANSNGLISRSC